LNNENLKNTQTTKPEELTTDNQMLAGSAWMTVGSLTSRVLGALYIIPWIAWMGGGETGAAANALFQMAYTPYTFFLMLATAGMPSAISKQVSYYNALGEYEISKSIYRQGMKIMIVTGIISAIIMFLLAPALASSGVSADESDAVAVIRALSPALLIIPIQSVTRGLFQGHSRMAEPAISQIVEQLVRIVFLLASVYLIRQILGGSVVTAVSFSTFAAFVGAVASFIYLIYRLKRTPTVLDRTPEESTNNINISTNQLLIEIFRTSIPFVFISTGVIIFQFVDQQTFAPLMGFLHETSEQTIQIMYGTVQGNAQKLIVVLTSFGTALAISSVPLISELIAKRDFKGVSKQFTEAVQLLLSIMLPAAIGMAVVAEPLYTVFYGYSELGVSVTRFYAFVAVVIAMYILLGNALQSANQKKKAVGALLLGFVIKLLSQPVFIYLAGPYGMLISTMLGLGITSLSMFRIMHHTVKFSASYLFRRFLLLLILSGIMGVATIIVRELLGLFINYQTRIPALIGMLLIAVVGVVVYGFLLLKSGIGEKLFGRKATEVRQKLNI